MFNLKPNEKAVLTATVTGPDTVPLAWGRSPAEALLDVSADGLSAVLNYSAPGPVTVTVSDDTDGATPVFIEFDLVEPVVITVDTVVMPV